jgi:hypothetical protein
MAKISDSKKMNKKEDALPIYPFTSFLSSLFIFLVWIFHIDRDEEAVKADEVRQALQLLATHQHEISRLKLFSIFVNPSLL